MRDLEDGKAPFMPCKEVRVAERRRFESISGVLTHIHDFGLVLSDSGCTLGAVQDSAALSGLAPWAFWGGILTSSSNRISSNA